MERFDPNAAATDDSGIFGLPYTLDEAFLVYLPIPWEATTSYGGGTSEGPAAILEASRQVDLFELEVNQPYQAGLHCLPPSSEILSWNQEAKALAQEIIECGGAIGSDPKLKKNLNRVNLLSAQVNASVYRQTQEILKKNKIAALIGGDHSVPLGAFKAIAEKNPEFGILHFDAHSDTRIAYEGFTYSHASIMYNALEEVPEIRKLVQVGIRDFCQQESEYCQSQGSRVQVHYDANLAREKFEGQTWASLCTQIIKDLPQKVWISFDIDGLDPRFCPHTGTPVPGGLDFNEAVFLIKQLAISGREIIGFDLNEVAPGPDGDEWDANIGARLLYKLTAWTLVSQKKITQRP